MSAMMANFICVYLTISNPCNAFCASLHAGIKPKVAPRRNILLHELPRRIFQVLCLTVQKIYSKEHGLHLQMVRVQAPLVGSARRKHSNAEHKVIFGGG